MVENERNTSQLIEATTQALKPMWSPLFNLGLAAFAGVISAVTAFGSTNSLRDGSTLVAIPVGIVAWFVGDILRWRGRYPMRVFLMVPIFVALVCSVSVRFLQKPNQRRVAWNSMMDAGAIVKFDSVRMNGWVQYEEGIFLPEFLEDWVGKAVFASSAEVAISMSSFSVDSPELPRLRDLELQQSQSLALEIGDSSRNRSKTDLEVFSKFVNSNRVEVLTVKLFEPDEETILALHAIRRPYYLYLSGVLSEKSMRHFPSDRAAHFIYFDAYDPPGQTSWLNFLPSSPNCLFFVLGSISAESIRTIDQERPLCKMRFEGASLDDNAIQEIAQLSRSEFIHMGGNSGSQDSIDAMCESPASWQTGPVSLTPTSVQSLIDNKSRTRLHLTISSIDSTSFQRLAEVKCLKSICIEFELTEQDIQSIKLFSADVELTMGYSTHQSRETEIQAAINERKDR